MMTMPLESNLRFHTDSVRKKQRMRVLNKVTIVVAAPRQECRLEGFVVEPSELIEWKCVTLLVLQCCDNAGGRNISAMVHVVSIM